MVPDTKKDDEDGRAEGQIRFSTADSADALTDHGDMTLLQSSALRDTQ